MEIGGRIGENRRRIENYIRYRLVEIDNNQGYAYKSKPTCYLCGNEVQFDDIVRIVINGRDRFGNETRESYKIGLGCLDKILGDEDY